MPNTSDVPQRSPRATTTYDEFRAIAAMEGDLFDGGAAARALESVLDAIPDVVFFVKDAAARYTHVNLTLVHRVGMKHRDQVIGRDVKELYASALADSYAKQDQRVLCGETLENHLEVQVLPNRTLGWCVTNKRPLRTRGTISGIIGISRDLGQADTKKPIYTGLRRVVDYLQAHYAEDLRIHELAALGGFSVAQLGRCFRNVFHIPPQQMQTRLRIEAAMALLRSDESIAAISQLCGFADQSAFARQFKATVGMTPTRYRSVAGSTTGPAGANGEPDPHT